ncbi:MAG: hypothetical protein GF308_17635 [Candidatus Heimdallarchaeota archaeon]|nr:hypothetical protein [Candidatus Heimdallarchaeota archaeon]
MISEQDPRFFWTHGMEMELQIIDKTGKVIGGEEAMRDIEPIIKEAKNILIEILESTYPPPAIQKKIQSMPALDRNKEKGLVVVLGYSVPGQDPVMIDIIGRDGNVTIATYILELVTPPSETVEELTWWAKILQHIMEQALPSRYQILSTGLNPLVDNYTRGLSFADQHHIGIQNQEERMAAYNSIRNFVPHLIGLSTNSPFINGLSTDSVRIARNRVLAPGCVKSLRLQKNETMLSAGLPSQYIPYMRQYDPDYYVKITQKASLEDAKYQDIFPFTQFGTIETRIMDAQLTLARRIGFALVVQALAKKGVKYYHKGKTVPNAGSEDLFHNRKSAIERGLLAPHRKSREAIWANEKIDGDFVKYYYGTFDRQLRYMFQSVQNMFLYIEPELREMGAWDTPYINTLMASVFWGLDDKLLAPVTGAEYQLYLYETFHHDIQKTIKKLREIYLQSIEDPTYDPISSKITVIDPIIYDQLEADPVIPIKEKTKKTAAVAAEKKSFIGVIKKEDLVKERKLNWWIIGAVFAVIIIIGVVLGIILGL